jgi:hypothetical protein
LIPRPGGISATNFFCRAFCRSTRTPSASGRIRDSQHSSGTPIGVRLAGRSGSAPSVCESSRFDALVHSCYPQPPSVIQWKYGLGLLGQGQD